MKAASFVVGVCALSAGFTQGVWAIPSSLKISKPVLDVKADLFTVPNSGGIPTTSTYITIWGSAYQSPTWGAPAAIYPINNHPPIGPYGAAVNTFNDYIILHDGGGVTNNSAERYAAAAAYVVYNEQSLPTDTMSIYTIYGVDLDPNNAAALSLGGYDTTNGPLPVLGDEQFTGPSGTTYLSEGPTLKPISDLSALLGPDADLSIFGGDTGKSVMVFQTAMPFSEMGVVPEPAALSLLALGGPALLRRRRRAGN